MEAFLTFFELMPAWQKLAWIFIVLCFSWIMEGGFPLNKFDYKKWRHAGVNLVFLSFSVAINLIFSIVTVGIFLWIQNHEFGLLFLFDLPVWLELLIAVLILDFFAQYLVHVMLHKYKWMWKLHMVHHSDTKVDATTGTRHHPGDYALREVFSLLAVFISGAPIAFYFFYRIVTIFFSYMTHANISMPKTLDLVLSWVFVTPNMHKFHHHFERPWTDSNYGNMFSFWDRIFGTFVYGDPKEVKYGLDVLEKEPDENILFQLKIPFNKDIKTDY
jgi:sterol desaturase/sphingolipid hydroxylase (fatty acid hydroxylase superfamily)